MIFPSVPTSNYLQILAAQAMAAKVGRFAPAAYKSGGETWFDGKGTFVLTDQSEWGRVWDRHIQNESIGDINRVGNLNPPPAVDFEKAFVVALFAGVTPGVVGYRFVSGFSMGRQATVRLAPVIDPQTSARVAVPRPWVFMVLPRSKSALDIQVAKGDGWTTILKIKPML